MAQVHRHAHVVEHFLVRLVAWNQTGLLVLVAETRLESGWKTWTRPVGGGGHLDLHQLHEEVGFCQGKEGVYEAVLGLVIHGLRDGYPGNATSASVRNEEGERANERRKAICSGKEWPRQHGRSKSRQRPRRSPSAAPITSTACPGNTGAAKLLAPIQREQLLAVLTASDPPVPLFLFGVLNPWGAWPVPRAAIAASVLRAFQTRGEEQRDRAAQRDRAFKGRHLV